MKFDERWLTELRSCETLVSDGQILCLMSYSQDVQKRK